MQETPDRIIAETERLYHAWHGRADGRIAVEFGPLIPWGCSPETLLRTHDLATAWGTGMHMHTAETQAEVEMSLQATGERHVEWLAELGILGPHLQLAHSVWLSDCEMELLAQSGAVVVHCPVSNMFLASGIAPIAEMQRRGVIVALATDGQACNNGEEP
jgi:5-methylthioadenosine/S-adenosylhomocysteine deaminase